MIYLFSRKNYPGLQTLTSALGATRLHRFDGEHFWDQSKKKRILIPSGSVVVPWGAFLPELDGVRVLNGTEDDLNRTEIYSKLANFGVPTVKAYKEDMNSPTTWAGMTGYVPRKYGVPMFTNGSSVENIEADYYTQIIPFTTEFVVHTFSGKSIRAGEKVPMSGRALATSGQQFQLNQQTYAHPTIKTSYTGWTVDYTVPSTPEMRSVAHKAIKALGLTFGSVDIGQTASGGMIVISVSVGPEISGPLAIKAYVKAINKWAEPEAGVSNAL